MQAPAETINAMLIQAMVILQRQNRTDLRALDAFTNPIYATDADGMVTYFNPACIEFAGRTPVVGEDRWCVTWKLYTDAGDFLPHDQCPMAAAIQGERSIRGVGAIAERPDGKRRRFMPFPTPLFDADGILTGAVNIFVNRDDRCDASNSV